MSVTSFVAMVAGLGLASAAQAAGPVTCGQTVTADIKLVKDLGPCSGDGLVVTANGVTVDLGGHVIRGDGDPANTPDQVGIRLQDVTGVRVTNGVVRSFNGGVVIQGGSKNAVTDMTVANNVGSGTSLHGDGILIDASTGNTIRRDTVSGNGPYDGIALFHGASHNTISLSFITDNNVITSIEGQPDSQFDFGINSDSGSSDNTIDGNQVLRNGFAGIAPVGFDVAHTRITNNTVRNNGGTGIVAGGVGGHLVSNNIVDHNGYDQFRPQGTTPNPGGGIGACGRCLGPGDPTVIQSNVVTDNDGPGINLLFNGFLFNGVFTPPHPNVVRQNIVRGNTGDGIFVDCEQTFDTTVHCIALKDIPPHKGLRILDNTTGNNGGAGAGTTAWDLHDANAQCDSNIWLGNTYDTAKPRCTTRR